ncbi:very short patch repair endonuclease [Bosea sp. 2YAB26]|uniref:very short patch repair endonuclease n=1 Tax=Bosea sp. 2YAB26 TaxID=3237478 RepID=UPI003F919980
MIDVVDRQTRSRMMAGIKGKDTRPELALRMSLHRRGFRYRLHGRHLAGSPDLVLVKYGAVIFVHGCFWHRHNDCRYATTPSTRPGFWRTKFEANIARDSIVRAALKGSGWRVATVWECALRKPEQVEASSHILAQWLVSGSAELELGRADLTA